MSKLVSKWLLFWDSGYSPATLASLAPALELIPWKFLSRGLSDPTLVNGIQESILIGWCPCKPAMNIFSIAPVYAWNIIYWQSLLDHNMYTSSGDQNFLLKSLTSGLDINILLGMKINVILENKHHVHVNPIVVLKQLLRGRLKPSWFSKHCPNIPPPSSIWSQLDF